MMDLHAPDGSTREAAPQLPELELHLTSNDVDRIQRHLCEQRADLLEGIARLEAQSAAGSASDLSSHRQRARNHRHSPLAILRGELEKTTRALGRLRQGTYGVCLTCGRPIALRRLAIVPSAEHCDECARSTSVSATAH